MDGDWRRAAERWEVIGCPHERAMALADGDESAQREALAVLDELGAVPAASLVRRRLRNRGASRVPRGPSRATRSNPAGLTDRQLEVLRLMADGLSNAEIATRLFLWKKTVERHMSDVYVKLGVDGRARAIAAAWALGVGPV